MAKGIRNGRLPRAAFASMGLGNALYWSWGKPYGQYRAISPIRSDGNE
jgi:hypothetical protein